MELAERLIKRWLAEKYSEAALAEIDELVKLRIDNEALSLEELELESWDDYEIDLMFEAFYDLREVGRDELVKEAFDDEPFEDFLARIAARAGASKRDRYVYDVARGSDPEAFPESLDEVGDEALAALVCCEGGFYAAALGDGKFLIDPERRFIN